jgi:hypothetical protein
MGELSKSERGEQQKGLGESGLGEFDSVKKVSILGDTCGKELNDSFLPPTLSFGEREHLWASKFERAACEPWASMHATS